MKAIVLKNYGGIENFELQEVEEPQIKNNEVLIRIKATAFNPIDYQMRQGSTESKLLKSPILGRELSGEIVKLGKDVSAFKIGDKVSAYVGSLASNGTYAEFISVPEKLVAKNPANTTFEEASAIPMVGMTALQCFKRVIIPKHEAVFISGGAGGVGTILIKLLIANGNNAIFTTAGSTESIAHLKKLGIDESHIINYKKDDVVTALKAKKEYFKFTIDLVGGKMSEVCADLVDVFGTYVNVTYLSTDCANELLFDKATTIVNIANYAPSLKNNSDTFEYYKNTLNELFDRLEKNIISPTEINVIGGLTVETVQTAHMLMENNQTKGKKLIMSIP